MPKISLVCHFYNSGKFIPALIESVLAQDFEDWEIIAVNDCSPGNDLAILERYAADPRIKGRLKVIDNPVNLGISKAKEVGWKSSTGKYVMFSDGDDTLEPHAFSKSFTAAEMYQSDIVIMDVWRVYKLPFHQKKKLSKSSARYNEIYTKDSIREELMHSFYGINLLSGVGYWGKLFRRTLLEKSEYVVPKHGFAEDLLFNLEAFRKAERIVFIDYPAYNWYWGGLTSGSKAKRLNQGKEQSFYSATSVIERYEDLYSYRIKIIESDNLPPILKKFLIIELKNVLIAQYAPYSSEKTNHPKALQVKNSIRETISKDAYDIPESVILQWPELRNSKGMMELIDKDIDSLYEITHRIYIGNWKSRLIKSLLSIFH